MDEREGFCLDHNGVAFVKQTFYLNSSPYKHFLRTQKVMTSSLLWDDEVIKRSIPVKINKLALSSKMALLVRIKRTDKIGRSNLDLDKNYYNNLVRIKSVKTKKFWQATDLIIRTMDSITGRSGPHSWTDEKLEF